MSDAVAEALEAAGLYRRAARRWLEVLDRCCDSEEWAWLAARRSQCLVNAR
ncbi:PerC family transcriptional regulator, partial [Salmonella enterica]|nr:PerC family transcriptional regulator [Salmonella enterica]